MLPVRGSISTRDCGVRSTLCIIFLVCLVGLSNAQVYLSGSGSTWIGACDNSCPQSEPCRLSTTGSTTVSAACTLWFASGMAIPGHVLSASFSGNLTLSTLGEVSIAADLSVTNTNGGVVLNQFKYVGASKLKFTTARTYIESSTITISGNSQMEIVGSSVLSARNSYFTSSNPMLRCIDLAAGTVIDLSGMSIQSAQGVTQTIVSVFGNEPSIRIRNSNIVGFLFSTSRLKDVTIENVVGTLTSGSIFTTVPKTITMSDCRFTSTDIALMGTTSGTTTTLSLTRCHFDNVVLRGMITGSSSLVGCTFIADDLSYIILDFSSGYGTSMTLTDVAVITRSATGSAPVISSFLYSTSSTYDSWSVSNLTYTSSSTVPRMKLTSGTYKLFSADFVMPSLQLMSATTTVHNTDNHITHAGDITTTHTSKSTVYHGSSTAEVAFHSINIGSNVEVQVMATVPVVRYHVTKPSQGIKCATSDCLSNFNGNYYVTWDESLPLPAIGTPYIFIDGVTTAPSFQPLNNDFSIIDSFASPIAYFTFQEVPCAANCVAAHSGPCVSRSICSCKSGWEGDNCECPTGGCPPPVAPAPVSTPISTPVSAPMTPHASPISPAPVSSPIAPAPVTVPSAPVSVPSAPVSVPSAPVSVPSAPVSVPSAPVSTPQATPPSVGPAPTSSPVASSPVASAPTSSPTTTTPSSTPHSVPASTPTANTPTANTPTANAPVAPSPTSNPPTNTPSSVTPTSAPSTSTPTGTPSGSPPTNTPTTTPSTSAPSNTPSNPSPSGTPPTTHPTASPATAPTAPTPTPIFVNTPTGAASARTSPFFICLGLIAVLVFWL